VAVELSPPCAVEGAETLMARLISEASMRKSVIVLAGVLLAGVWAQPLVLGDRPRVGGDARPAADAPPDPVLVKRGAYLVNEVARCGDCHTPRDARGRLDMTRHLQGAEMWFTPKVRGEEFEGHAPDITLSGKAGRWPEARMIKLLTSGKESDPPMPAYRLTEADARAMSAYMRSLPGKQGGDRREKGKEKGREREREKRKGRERERD
jgi:mono/diheme cytochrome c family protein